MGRAGFGPACYRWSPVALAPDEIVIEDRQSVAAFLEARLEVAHRQPSRNALHDLMVAIQVGNRRAQRALSLVFEGTQDAPLKRSILRRYAILDRALDQVCAGLDEMPPQQFLDMARSVVEAIDGGFGFAFTHIDDVRNTHQEVTKDGDTRPAQHRDPEGTSTGAWFSSAAMDDEGPTMRGVGKHEQSTRRGH